MFVEYKHIIYNMCTVNNVINNWYNTIVRLLPTHKKYIHVPTTMMTTAVEAVGDNNVMIILTL